MNYQRTVLIEGALMSNGEVLHFGKSLGFVNKEQQRLVEAEATKTARGGEAIVALGKNVA